ncbi:MAG TPA: UDP-N-acetylmuramoyl-tripeptide--D-alanyl-D-alanine ligase [Bryobacteraceae bacterium]|nr:UDP-N-acetylmuramoyl-tripeptide--D-alanyl-D-alanine ligase [Bryobacteraceae bacterium]
MKFSLRAVADALGVSAPANPDVMITGWSVDSRTVDPGDLFFALRGAVNDGHAHVAEVFAKGAVAAVVEETIGVGGPLLRVDDTLRALQELAAWARREWRGDVVAVTGSAGKTTTKDVIAEMLATEIATAKTQGNLNNHVGLPLSLLRLDESARVAVLELGMNHAGEIRDLAAIARPDVGVVTNVGYAHIENFDSVEGIAAAKRELVEALGDRGTAVLNADDPRVAGFAAAHKGRNILYGQSPVAQVRAEDVEYARADGSPGVRFRVGTTRFESALTGRHSVSNVLAGIAVAGVYGIPPERLKEKVQTLKPAKMRGERFTHNGILIYDDCYNSNPDAVRAMLEVLRDTPARRRIAVLGEMLELGRWAEPLHRDVGDYAAVCGLDVLVGIRGAAWHMVDAVKRAGLTAGAALFFDDPVAAGRCLRTLAEPGDAILFKGSRGVHVERALEEFLNKARN